MLVYASWPIYLLAWTLAVLRLPVGFRPTPKSGDTQLNILWLMPQLVTLVLLLVGEYQTMAVYHHPPSVILWFSIVQAFLQLMLLARWVQEDLAPRWCVEPPPWAAASEYLSQPEPLKIHVCARRRTARE